MTAAEKSPLIPAGRTLEQENEDLRSQVRELRETLDAIRSGEVDAIVVSQGEINRVYALEGADHPYRVLVENIQEGALTLTTGGMILYANAAFAAMCRQSPSEIIGTHLRDHTVPREHGIFDDLLLRSHDSPSRAVMHICSGAASVPVLVSMTPIAVNESLRLSVVVSNRKEDYDRLLLQSLMLDAVGDAVIATDPSNRIIYWSESAARIYGWQATEAMGRSLDEIVVRDLSPDDARRRDEQLGRGETWSGEYLARHRDGHRFPVQATKAPVYDEDGTLVAVIGASHNISERKRAEETLRASEEQFRALFEHSHDAIVLSDPRSGTIRAANPAACRMLGRGAEELIGRGPDVMVDPDEPRAVAMLQERANGGAAHTELTYRRRDGSTFPGEVSTALFTDGRGDLQSVAIIRDISERKRAEEALRESEERFRTVIDNSQDGINLLDLATGRYVLMSPSQVEMTGFTIEEINNISAEEAYERVHPEDREVSVAQQRLIAAGVDTASTVEYRWKVKSGEYRWFSDSRKIVRDARGEPVALVGASRDITEQKEAEEALRASEERFRALYEHSQDAIVLTDPRGEGRILSANPAACRMLGWTEEELVGRGRDVMFDPDDPKVAALLEERGRGGATFTELTYRRRNGSTFPGELGTALFTESHGDVRAVAIIRDVTERKRFDHALAESEADARSFMANMVDACAICEPVCDADGTPVDIRLIDVNPALSRELGLPSSAIVGRTASELLPDLAPFWFDRFLEVGRTGTAVEVEEPFPALGRWYRVVGFPVRGGRTAVLFRDITLRKQAEEALAESEERYRSLVENSIDAVMLTAPDGSVLAANAEACRIFGMTEEELILSGRDAVVDLSDPRLGPALEERQRTGRFRGELLYRRKDGTVFPGEVATALFTDPSGAVLTTIVVRDISDRKEAEAALYEYAERLRASNEELQRFAYVASHDLQEPLRSIVSFSQLLERRYKGKLDTDADEFIQFIVEGGQRMQTLIQDLLQVSRVETGARPLEPTDAGEVVNGALRLLETPIRETGAIVTVEPLPAVMADASQLEQVFVNLVGNAIKYRRDDVPPGIRIEGRRVGPMVQFAVQDNGIGIEAEYFDRIFEMFRRLHTHDEYGGTGIGLAVVKKIVDRHGGKVWVESVPGEGSTFFFTLPAA